MHLHALVPGGALKADGSWVAAKDGFMFPVKALSRVFRGKFVAALKRAREDGKLAETGLADQAWRDLLAKVHRHDWVVYAKQSLGGPEQVLDYLGRYTHRVAISNERILGMEGTRCVCGCATPPTATAGARSSCPRRPSSSASCCMCCPRDSSASVITASSARPRRR
ncbi:MAG: hypothetical protein EXR27_15760 [Betaproteobacteria bacterium]|nr:hypothetical protein [Betaproteobacteria bacterium]